MQFTQVTMSLQETFNNFLRGELMSVPMSQLLLNEVGLTDSIEADYQREVNRVKNKLNAISIIEDDWVLFVDYTNGLVPATEKAVLVRMLNLRYKDKYVIVLNEREVVYVPESFKTHNSLTELVAEVANKVDKSKNKNNKIRNKRETELDSFLGLKTKYINPADFLKENADNHIAEEVLDEAMATYAQEELSNKSTN